MCAFNFCADLYLYLAAGFFLTGKTLNPEVGLGAELLCIRPGYGVNVNALKKLYLMETLPY